MAIINQSNILNLQPGITAPVVVHMSEGDSGTKLSFRLIDGARAWTDPGNVVAAVHGRRQDGTQFGPYACLISGDVVSFETDAAMAGAAGSGIAEIVLTDSNGNTAGTSNFAILVERATFPMGVTYRNDTSVYKAILAYAQTIPAQVTKDYTAKIAAEAAARATADANLENNINTVQGALSTEISNRTTQDAVLSARMDEFTKLPDGSLSTAADAELVDIRVKANGRTASTAGDAVREQVTELKSDLNELEDGVDVTIQRAKSDDDKAWGNTNVYFYLYVGQTLTITNNGATNIWFALKDATDTTMNSFQIASGATASTTISTLPDHVAIYADTYPINVSITSISVSAYLDEKINDLKESTEDVTIDYLEGKICYANLSDFDLTQNKYYSNNLVPTTPTDANVYHIAPAFIVPAGTYSYYGIDSYWSFTVTASGTKTKLGSGGASGTVTLAESSTIYLSTRENITGYAQANWVSGNEVHNSSAPAKGYFSGKIERLEGFTQVMATVGMFGSVAALGDSYTATSVKNSSGTWADYPNQSWVATLCNRSNVTQYNYGVGGATIKSYASTNMFNSNVLGSDPKDLYFICFGINDYQQSLTVGTVADINDSDYTQNADTFCGWYGRVIAQLKTHAPNAKIVLIKPWTSVASASEYGDAVAAIAEHYSIPCIDPYDDIMFYGGYLTPSMNAGHPTLMGYNMMGVAMERLFSECVMNNPTYFKYSTVG